MRRAALTFAVMGFFVLALAAWMGGCSPFQCAVRGLIGAVGTYLLVRLAGRLIAGILADALVRSRTPQAREDKRDNP